MFRNPNMSDPKKETKAAKPVKSTARPSEKESAPKAELSDDQLRGIAGGAGAEPPPLEVTPQP
jgi:hypothetical protein